MQNNNQLMSEILKHLALNNQLLMTCMRMSYPDFDKVMASSFEAMKKIEEETPAGIPEEVLGFRTWKRVETPPPEIIATEEISEEVPVKKTRKPRTANAEKIAKQKEIFKENLASQEDIIPEEILPTPAIEQKNITMHDVRQASMDLATAKGREALVSLLGSFNAKVISEIPEDKRELFIAAAILARD